MNLRFTIYDLRAGITPEHPAIMAREEMFRLGQLANRMAEGNELLAIVVAAAKTARESRGA